MWLQQTTTTKRSAHFSSCRRCCRMADPTSYVSAANMKKNVLYEEWQPLGPPDRPTAQCVELYYISFVDEIKK